MADDCEKYIFEYKRETSNDFALANGDVISVLKGLRTDDGEPAPFAERDSYLPDSTASKRVPFDADGLSGSRHSNKARAFSASAPNNALSSPAGAILAEGAPASRLTPAFSVSSRNNTSNGEDLTVRERETPLFSGLFAKHDGGESSDYKNISFAGAEEMIAVFPDTPERTGFFDETDIVSVEETRTETDAAAGNASLSGRRGVKLNLTFSAEEMAGFRSYQVGGDPGNQSQGASGSIVYHSGKASANDSSSSGDEPGVSEPAFDWITIDDPLSPGYGWIGIPERPIGGWIGIPERPIGGWIIYPQPFEFEEYDVFDDYGVELSCDWTEYTDSDFSKVDLEYGSKLSFSVRATNAATFTIYRSIQDEKGGYTLRALQTTALVYDAESGDYGTTTQAILLEAGQYCLCVQSSEPVREGDPAASYRFELDTENSDMFVDGDNSDDWTDLRTAGEFGAVDYAGELDDCSYDVLDGWVGFGDAVDYAGFTLASAAKLSFTIDAADAAQFTLYQLVRDAAGKYFLKTLQTTALVYDPEFEEYTANTKSLLLEAGDYYLSMQSTNAAQGGSADYSIYLNDEDDDAVVFFTEGDNSDDWTDIVSKGAMGEVACIGVIDENSYDLLTDWVGFGDAVDYAGFTLASAAKLSFTIDATDAAQFTLYQLVRDASGKYFLKTLQTTALAYDREYEEYAANTKSLLLEAGDYYISMRSTNATQGGNADYDIYLNDEDDGAVEFFPEGNNSDDWTDLRIAGASGEVGYIGVIDEDCAELASDWVGFGDAVDYMGFTLDNAAELSFSLEADGATQFTIYQLIRDGNGVYSLKALQTTALSYVRRYDDYEATTKSLYLTKGDYYISMQSANAATGGGANYTVSLNDEDSRFFTVDKCIDNWAGLEFFDPDGDFDYLGYVDEYSEELTDGQIAGNDAGYMCFTLDYAAKLSFSLNADNAAKFTLYTLVQDRNGKYFLKALQTAATTMNRLSGDYEAVTKALLLEAGDYYISMKAATSADVNYSIGIDGAASTFYPECDNSDDWTDLRTEGECGEVGYVGGIDEDTTELLTDWVGFGDAVDYMEFSIDDPAKLSFSVIADDAVVFTIYELVQSKSEVYSLKALQTTATTLNRLSGDYEAVTKALLLEAGDYYFSVQSTNAGQGGSAYYTVNFNAAASTFYPECDNSDDWTDLATEGECGEVGYVGGIDEDTTELLTDWVGFGDAVDYMEFSIDDPAKLSFSVIADDAVTFTIYELVQSKSEVYSLKALQTTATTLNRLSGDYETVTKALLLEAGDYYFSVQSTNAGQGGSAYYTVNFNTAASTFYPECDNSDDWTDLATEGECGEVGYVGVIDEDTTELLTDWVGFGDEIDYSEFTIYDDAELSFTLEATDAAVFTVYSLLESANGTYKLKTLQTSPLVFDNSTRKYSATTKALKLEAGDYYFSVHSTNAGQGGSAYYELSLNASGSAFFPEENEYDDEDAWAGIGYIEVPKYYIDTPRPVDWTVVCGYPAYDVPAAAPLMEAPADDVLAAADKLALDGVSAELAGSGPVGSKPVDALKELSAIA